MIHPRGGWQYLRTKYLCTAVDERAGLERPPLLSVSIHLGVVPRDQLTDDMPRADDLSSYKLCQKGDIVLNRMRAFQGAIGIAPQRGLVSPDYIVLRVHDAVDGPYLHHLFRSGWFVSEMVSRLRGIGSVEQGNVRTPRINVDDLASISVPVPPRDQQRAIADFLDAETGRIDALIDKKTRLVELLSERLAAQIDVALWSSEDVASPALSVVVEIAEGQVDPREPIYCDLPLIAPNHVESGTGRIFELESAAEQGAISGKYLCNRGDVIYSKIRPALRKACLAPARCLTSADMYPMRPLAGLTSEYLLYFLLSDRFTDFAVLESDRVAMPKINRDALGRIRMQLPSAEVQELVVADLNRSRSWSATVMHKLLAQVELLREHREALITAAVVGDLEVSGVAA